MLLLHQAILAIVPLGHSLTIRLRTSSTHKTPKPSGIGRNQNSSGTGLVPKRSGRLGTSVTSTAMARLSTMPKRSHGLLCLLVKGSACTIRMRRLRIARIFPYCIMTRLTK